ncbi:MAG: hypothetical protein AB1705_02445 [Verrucomicrobiota bacterium]
MNRRQFLLATGALALANCGGVKAAFGAEKKAKARVPKGFKLLYEQDFESASALDEFVFTDPKAWRLAKDDKGNSSLELFSKSKYEPKHRSPFNIAVIADKMFGDFILEVDLLSTKAPYGHQDMCVFFGMQEPLKFYYNHIAVAADPNAHNIFIVNDAPRKNFASKTTKGITWGLNEWHKVRLERDTKSGTIKSFFDDLNEPIMLAEDKTFTSGYIGFGSFDDVGKIDNIRIWGPSAETKRIGFYRPAK